MTKKNPRNNLPRLISGMWLLNLSGAIGLIAFFWYLRNPVLARQGLVPTLEISTSPTTQTFVDFQAEQIPNSLAKTSVAPQEPLEISTPTPNSNKTIIGYSVAGRPLEVYQFGNGPTARLIVAGIHGGNEWNTIKLANELMEYVEDHPEIIPKEITLYILPSLNPDGDARIHGVDGRVNDNGVDLNRNWPYRWEKNFVRSNCWDYRKTTAGPYPASEPETAALLVFIVSHPEIDALISYHAAALGIFAGGVPEYKPSVLLAESIAKVSTYQYPPIDIGCKYTGNLTDWAANNQEIAAVDIELHNFKFTDFYENSKILKVFLNFKI